MKERPGPITRAETLRPNTKFYQSSKFVVTYVPYFMAALYVILIPISLWSKEVNFSTIFAKFPTWVITIWNIALAVGISALAIVFAAAAIRVMILGVIWCVKPKSKKGKTKTDVDYKHMAHEVSMWVYKKMVEGIVQKLLDNLEKVDNSVNGRKH